MKKALSRVFLFYLRTLSKIQLGKINPLIIGVGGSSGKTSVSYLVTLILENNHKVRNNVGKNSETGIPLSILNLDPGKYDLAGWLSVAIGALMKVLTDFNKYEFLIIEMGIDGPKSPKNMGYLLTIVKPDVSILTNIALEHSVYFEDMVKDVAADNKADKILEAIRSDQSLLIKKLNSNDFAVINEDDNNIKMELKDVKAKILSVSSSDSKANFLIKSWKPRIKDTTLKFSNEGEDYELKIKRPLPGIYAYSTLLSIAAAKAVGVEISESIKTIEDKFDLPGGRLSVFEGIKDCVIIDSTYNNNLEAISAILEMVSEISEGRRKGGIIGDIREQGEQAKGLHEKMAEKIMQNLDYVILIGPLTAKFVQPILEKHKFNSDSFETYGKAREHILKNIEKNDLILIKGSQNTLFLERAVELLLKNKKDVEKLPRRGVFWDNKRASTA